MSTKITVAGWQRCGFFQKAANVVCALQHLYPGRVVAEILELPDREAYNAWLPQAHAKVQGASRITSSPLVWINENELIGGCDDTLAYARREFTGTGSSGRIKPVAQATLDTLSEDSGYDYDLIVIGGGSGGLACSKRAAGLGKKVAVLDFVKPSPIGTKWGLGGTCVNVGCIPKKLMHTAALLGESLDDAKAFGWGVEPSAVSHEWTTMVQSVQNHIKKLNFGYRVQLREKKVKYLNELGTIVGPHEIECVNKSGKSTRRTARRFVVAVGGRPRPLSCPGGELAVSSDDLFSLKDSPGKTLVVGASYVALECAGFLRGLKLDVTVMVRSILLRGFDRDMAERIGKYMEKHGTKFIRGAVPESLERTSDGRIKVSWGGGASDVYDTVFSAIGRDADTRGLGLDAAGVTPLKNGKLDCQDEQVKGGAPHIYAIGDVVDGRPELTPVAIQAGKLLADRLYDGSKTAMDYERVCTTVFTPIEYGCCGLSEEDAESRLGSNMEVFHTSYTPLEWQVPEEREENSCYCKVIVDKTDSNRVVGLHILGPNAGEITQGFGVAMKMGMTFDDLVSTVGIHPTTAEELTTLSVTKASGESTDKGGC